MILRAFDGKKPRIGQRVFVAENAALIGDVEIGNDCSIWFGTTIRGDVNLIRIGSRTNVQDNCTIHVDPGFPVSVGAGVTIGHGAIVHGCTVEENCLIGMGATVLNGARIGRDSLVGAGALVTEGKQIPPGSLVVGVPARVLRELTPEEIEGLRRSAQGYYDHSRTFLGGQAVRL